MRPNSRSSNPSSRCDMDAVVGVPLGLVEVPAYARASRLGPPRRPIGWLAVEGAGDGV
jgi:hypothetical protein